MFKIFKLFNERFGPNLDHLQHLLIKINWKENRFKKLNNITMRKINKTMVNFSPVPTVKDGLSQML